MELRSLTVSLVCMALVACNTLTGAAELREESASSTSASSSGSGKTDGGNGTSGSSASSSSSSSSSSGSNGTGGSSGISSSTSSTSSTSSSGASGTIDDAGPPPGATSVIHDTFDSQDACGQWKITAGQGTITWDGIGACMVCSSAGIAGAGAITIEKSGTTSTSGLVTIEAYAKRFGNGGTPTSASIGLKVGGASVSSGGNINASGYTRISGAKVSVSPGASVTASVGTSNAASGDCIVFDSVSVYIE